MQLASFPAIIDLIYGNWLEIKHGRSKTILNFFAGVDPSSFFIALLGILAANQKKEKQMITGHENDFSHLLSTCTSSLFLVFIFSLLFQFSIFHTFLLSFLFFSSFALASTWLHAWKTRLMMSRKTFASSSLFFSFLLFIFSYHCFVPDLLFSALLLSALPLAFPL